MTVIKGFGERVSQERRQKGLDERRDVLKRDVARALGVSESTVGRWERGTLPDDPELLERLAAYFGVTAAWLHYGVGPREAPPSLDDSAARESVTARADEKPAAAKRRRGA